MRFRFFLLLPFIAAPAARANFAVAPVLNIVRKAPLFEKPSSRARMLGEADADTPVLGRRLSPQGSWLLVEDSDGNQGWIPTGRSNYSQVMQVGDQVLPGETEAPKPSRQDGGILPMSMPKDFDQDAPPSSPSRGAGGTWEVSAAYRTLITRSSTPGFPVGLSYLQAAGAQGPESARKSIWGGGTSRVLGGWAFSDAMPGSAVFSAKSTSVLRGKTRISAVRGSAAGIRSAWPSTVTWHSVCEVDSSGEAGDNGTGK